MSKAYLVKNNAIKPLSSDLALELMQRYVIVGTTYNQHGQVIYIHSKNHKRIHSILIRLE